jgi:hypothetical protein
MSHHSPPAPPTRARRTPAFVRAGARYAALLAVATVGLGPTVAPAGAAPSDGRHYELATPPDKLSHNTRSPILSADGTALAFDTEPGNGLPGDPSHGAAANPYLSQRSPSGWVFSSWGLDASLFGGTSRAVDVTPDLTTRLYFGANTEEFERGAGAFYLRHSATGTPERFGPVLEMQPGGDTEKFVLTRAGVAADLRSLVFTSQAPNVLLPGEPAPATEALYEVSRGADGALRRVDVGNDGNALAPACGAAFGHIFYDHTAGALSDDGRRIVFSARTGAEDGACGSVPARLFVRIDGRTTVELSASECRRDPADPCLPVTSNAEFKAASGDGRRVFFSTVDQLVDEDTDTAPDLYLYDVDAPPGDHLTRVSERPAPDAGYQGFLRAAHDGSRIYYVARGVLATNANAQGDRAATDADNLYVHDVADNRPTFVATMDPSDAPNWTQGDGSGIRTATPAGADARRLVFASAARVTADDTDAATDLFRFDAQDGSLERVSIGMGGRGNDEVPATSPGPSYQQVLPLTQARNPVSADGSHVLFHTTEPLVPEDTNGAGDVYEWVDGRVTLASDGQDPTGAGGDGYGMAISADGSTVAFTTARALVATDRDTAVDVYVLRGGDDVTAPVAEEPPACDGDACQPPPGGSPPLGAPITPSFVGPGNASPGDDAAPRSVRLGVPARTKTRGSIARLRIRVPAAGRLRVTGAGLRRVTQTIAKAGTYTVTVRLTSAARRALVREGSTNRRARITLTLANRRSVTATARIAYATTRRSSSRPRSVGAVRKDRS